jgi:hypothetical protein
MKEGQGGIVKIDVFPVPGIQCVGLSAKDNDGMVIGTLSTGQALRLIEQLRLFVQGAEKEAGDD